MNLSLDGICPICKMREGILMLNQYGPCSACVPITVSVKPVTNIVGRVYGYWQENEQVSDDLEYSRSLFSYLESVEWLVLCLNTEICQPNMPSVLHTSGRPEELCVSTRWTFLDGPPPKGIDMYRLTRTK